MPGFTYLALNSSFHLDEQPETMQTIMMITWKTHWDIEYFETCSTLYESPFRHYVALSSRHYVALSSHIS